MVQALPNERKLPAIGFGTADLTGDIKEIIKCAVRCGHRLIDTAAVYGSEEAIGVALRELETDGEIRREELFIETKLEPGRRGYEAVLESFQHALNRLQMEYVDMFLIHWPVPRGSEKTYAEENGEIWRAFEALYREGRVRAIGVCNFLERHLLQIMETCSIAPMLNQLELHPGYQQRGLVRFCRERGMLIEAWSPMGRGILNKPEFQEMAAFYEKDIGQLALRWSVENGYIPLTRSSAPGHIAKNLEIFDFALTEDDRDQLNALNTNDGHMDIWSYRRQQMY